MRPKSDKENKANSFTLWEDAHSHNVSVCGQYISMWDIYQASLTGENALHVTFPDIIGFDDLLPFQNFGDFPSYVLGDFKLYIRVLPDALVWCSLSPQESIRQMAEVYPFTENSDHEIFNYKQCVNKLSSTRQQNNYDHRFTQVNSFGLAATNCVSDLIAALPNDLLGVISNRAANGSEDVQNIVKATTFDLMATVELRN
jgi:hypothetical protein